MKLDFTGLRRVPDEELVRREIRYLALAPAGGSASSVRYRRAMMLLASAGGNRVP